MREGEQREGRVVRGKGKRSGWAKRVHFRKDAPSRVCFPRGVVIVQAGVRRVGMMRHGVGRVTIMNGVVGVEAGLWRWTKLCLTRQPN